MIMVGVISYLPDDPKVRKVRWSTSTTCFANLIILCQELGVPLHVVTTNWKESEFKDLGTSNIIYHTIDMDNRGAAVSRNELLKTFYNSGCDYLLMCDDDAYIYYNYYNLIEFLRRLHTEPRPFIDKGLFHICSKLANHKPFKEENLKDLDFADNWVFKLGGDSAGRCPQIFTNFKKYFNTEIYQDESLFRELRLGGEDTIFDLNLMLELGVTSYMLTSFIASTIEVTSSFWQEKKSKKEMLKDEVWQEGQATLDYIKSKYPGVKQTTKYRLDFRAYRPVRPKKVLVPRISKYTYTDWDFPVKRVKPVPSGLLKGDFNEHR